MSIRTSVGIQKRTYWKSLGVSAVAMLAAAMLINPAFAAGTAQSSTPTTSATSAESTTTTPSAGPYQPVTNARLMDAENSNGWLMFRRSYTSKGYAPFNQINTGNVKDLKEAWLFRPSSPYHGYEAAPIVNGNYMFVTGPRDALYAFDASTGKPLWSYTKKLEPGTLGDLCCGVVNRGVALFGNDVYMATLDNFVVALDAKTGKVIWQKQLVPSGTGYSMTVAPLVVKGKVIVGESGGEYGARDFIEALNANNGDEVWRTYTVPAPNQPGGDTWPKGAYKHGGGAAWVTGTYNSATNTLYWGVGNPGPWLGTARPGANLYTDSVLALDPDSGAIKWYYQYTRHGVWDYDGVDTPVMTDLTFKGHSYKALVATNRNGWFYALNREDGKLIYARPLVTSTTMLGVRDGHTVPNASLRPKDGHTVFACPAWLGGSNWPPISVDPQTNMAYIPTTTACMTLQAGTVTFKAGLPYMGEIQSMVPDPVHPHHFGNVVALNLSTGQTVWNHRSRFFWYDGMLSTAGGLVFSGGPDRHFYAFDARTGKILWKSPKLVSGVRGVPVTYKVDGTQYIAFWAGWGGTQFPGAQATNPAFKAIPLVGELYVFALPKD